MASVCSAQRASRRSPFWLQFKRRLSAPRPPPNLPFPRCPRNFYERIGLLSHFRGHQRRGDCTDARTRGHEPTPTTKKCLQLKNELGDPHIFIIECKIFLEKLKGESEKPLPQFAICKDLKVDPNFIVCGVAIADTRITLIAFRKCNLPLGINTHRALGSIIELQ